MSEATQLPAADPKLICTHCPTSAKDEWAARGAILRMEIRRHEFTLRELLVTELILGMTYGQQLDSVVIPDLSYFDDILGISDTDVVKILKKLHRKRVLYIREHRSSSKLHYSINANTEAWKLDPRTEKSDMQRAINRLREWNGLEPINIEQEAALSFFKSRHDAKKIVAEMGDLPMGEPTGQHTDEFPNFL
ncbi:MAG TPA: hypothetical protein VNN22_08035 [Verrucomicrobiae bacterium]|nr:hypothetical protein [Verrucomicrobiae bacterium]